MNLFILESRKEILVREEWEVPAEIAKVMPYKAGTRLSWKILSD